MFTGIVAKVAKVKKAEVKNGSLILQIQKPKGWQIKKGSSVATDGVCLTANKVLANHYEVELISETLEKTTFGKQLFEEINLEQSLKLSDRIDGHFVTGHVDAVGEIKDIKKQGSSYVYKINFPAKFSKFLVKKGSIAVDGISLTIVDISKNFFTVHIVGHTHKNTNLKNKKAKDLVNLEFDLLAKYALKNK